MKGDCQRSHPGVWSIILLLAVTSLLVVPPIWYRPMWFPGTARYDEQYQYHFMLTENSSTYMIPEGFYQAVEIAIRQMSTNGTPVTLVVSSFNGATHRFHNLTIVKDETLTILPQSLYTEMRFSRQDEDAWVDVILVVTRELHLVVDAIVVVAWPLLIVSLCLGGFALWRLNSIERECRTRLAYQVRWTARNGLSRVAVLLILAGVMVAPFVGTWMSGGYRQVQTTVVTYSGQEIYVDTDERVISLYLAYFVEEHPMEGIIVSSIISEHPIGLDLWRDGYLLLRLPSITNLNESYIRIEDASHSRLDVSRIEEDSNVLVTVGFEKTVNVMANDPVPFLAIIIAAVIPLAAGLRRLRHIQSALRNGPYLVEEEDSLPSSGLEVQ